MEKIKKRERERKMIPNRNSNPRPRGCESPTLPSALLQFYTKTSWYELYVQFNKNNFLYLIYTPTRYV